MVSRDYFDFLPAIAVFLITTAGYIIYRQYFIEIISNYHNTKLFTSNKMLWKRKQSGPIYKEHRVALSAKDVREGISEIKSYINDLSPDWIIGLHLGGRLLSVYISDKISYPIENCLFMCRSPEGDTLEILHPSDKPIPNPPYEGKLLIIDDISRSGITFSTIRGYFMKINYKSEYHLRHVYFATLLEMFEPHPARNRSRPDWSWGLTTDIEARFPWSLESAKFARALNLRRSGFKIDKQMESLLDEFRRIGTDYQYALKMAKKYIDAT
jgi:hypothetical protein